MTPDEIRYRRGLIRRRRRGLPPPAPMPDGLYLLDPQTNTEHFISWEDLSYLCKDMVNPSNADVVERELGKLHWRNDPTYNLRRRK
jgi:hypothetical protein